MSVDGVKIVEVGPRDGLQNEKQIVPVDIKLNFINQLIASGLSVIEATSFVSPKWIPQMADHTELVQRLPQHAAASFPVLVPNLQGFENALAAGAKQVAVFTAASETFSQKNTNCSIAESLQRFAPIFEQAKARQIPVRAYISCVMGCPYEGEIVVDKVAEIAQKLLEMGSHEVSLGDTIGVGTVSKTKTLINTIKNLIPINQLAIHFHDTYGQALANIYAALELGIRTIDASTAGLGGCPYAKGASGNVASEDVVYLLNGLGIPSGVDLEKLIAAGDYISQYLNRRNQSKVARAMLAKTI